MKRKTKQIVSATPQSASLSGGDSWVTVDIAEYTVTLQRGTNYRLPLDFSQSPVGAGQFDSALYLTTLASSNFPETVVQEDSNYKTEQRCAWIIYVPDDGYQTMIQVKFAGQMRGTGWTGGGWVNGQWGSLEVIY
jgi:hypothetical protein